MNCRLQGAGLWCGRGALAVLSATAGFLAIAWAGVDAGALAKACAGLGVAVLLGLVSAVSSTKLRGLPPAGLVGAVGFCALVAWHALHPVPPEQDSFHQLQWLHFSRTIPACILTVDTFLRGLFPALLLCATAACAGVLRRDPGGFASLVLPALGLCCAVAAAGGWAGLTGETLFGRFGRAVSDRPVATFFHDTAGGAWLNLTAGLALTVAFRLWRRSRVAAAICAVCAVLVLAVHRAHESDAAHLLAAAPLLGALGGLRSWRLPELRWPRAGLVAGVLVAALLVVGWATDDRQAHAPRTPVAGPLELLPIGEDRLLPSDDPIAREFLGDRRLAASAAIRQISASPWLGWGPAGWALHYHRFTADPLLRSFFLYLQFTHNDPLQFWLEWGLLGLLCGALIAAGPLAAVGQVLAGADRLERCAAGAAIGALAALALHGSVDFPGQIPAVQALAAVVLLAGCCQRPGFQKPLLSSGPNQPTPAAELSPP